MAEIKELSEYYQPAWTPEEGESGTALAEAFSGMIHSLGAHLNKVPQKHLLAFLEHLDERLVPPRAAKVPVKFGLAPDSPEETVLPKGFQVLAPATDDRPEALFEVVRPVRVGRAELVAIVATDPATDSVYDHTPSLEAGHSFGLFDSNDTSSVQEHHLYLGDEELFAFGTVKCPEKSLGAFALVGAGRTKLEGRWEGAVLDESGEIEWVEMFSNRLSGRLELDGILCLDGNVRPEGKLRFGGVMTSMAELWLEDLKDPIASFPLDGSLEFKGEVGREKKFSLAGELQLKGQLTYAGRLVSNKRVGPSGSDFGTTCLLFDKKTSSSGGGHPSRFAPFGILAGMRPTASLEVACDRSDDGGLDMKAAFSSLDASFDASASSDPLEDLKLTGQLEIDGHLTRNTPSDDGKRPELEYDLIDLGIDFHPFRNSKSFGSSWHGGNLRVTGTFGFETRPHWWKFYRWNAQALPMTTINGVDSRWIRFVAKKGPAKDVEIPDLAIEAEYRSTPTAAFFNTEPCSLEVMDEKNPVRPFGPAPVPQDAFYIASTECFSKPGARVTMLFELSEAGIPGGIPPEGPDLETRLMEKMDRIMSQIQGDAAHDHVADGAGASSGDNDETSTSSEALQVSVEPPVPEGDVATEGKDEDGDGLQPGDKPDKDDGHHLFSDVLGHLSFTSILDVLDWSKDDNGKNGEKKDSDSSDKMPDKDNGGEEIEVVVPPAKEESLPTGEHKYIAALLNFIEGSGDDDADKAGSEDGNDGGSKDGNDGPGKEDSSGDKDAGTGKEQKDDPPEAPPEAPPKYHKLAAAILDVLHLHRKEDEAENGKKGKSEDGPPESLPTTAVSSHKRLAAVLKVLHLARKGSSDASPVGGELEKEAGDGGKSVPTPLSLSWEYWNGIFWTPLPPESPESEPDSSFKFAALRGNVSFICPADLASCEVNGVEDRWIRVRIARGDYGSPVYKLDGTQDDSLLAPPAVKAISLRANIKRPPRHCMTFNDIQFRMHPTGQGGKREVMLPFSPFPSPGYDEKTFYMGFNASLSEGPLSIYMDMERPVAIPANRPLIRWAFHSDKKQTWVNLPVEDETQRLLVPGTLRFFAPSDLSDIEMFGRRLWWIKGTLHGWTDRADGAGLARIRHTLFNTDILVEGETTTEELVGSSEGRPSQSFRLGNSPVLEVEVWVDELGSLTSDGMEAALEAEGQGVKIERDSHGEPTHVRFLWKRIERLYNAAPGQRVFEIDHPTGTVTFGNGKEGRIPPAGRDNITAVYRVGGGARGNVSARAVCKANTSDSYLKTVVNPLEAGGGTDTETLAGLLARSPLRLRHGRRATTPSDFEALVLNADPSVAMVRCLGATDAAGNRAPGYVWIIVVPHSRANEPRPGPSVLLQQFIIDYLKERACGPLAEMERIAVCGPTYVLVSVKAEMFAPLDFLVRLKDEAVASLEKFLHPVTGGPDGRGWHFGQVVSMGDIYHHLEGIPDMDHIDSLELLFHDEAGNLLHDSATYSGSPTFSGDTLPSSGTHEITVRAVDAPPDAFVEVAE